MITKKILSYDIRYRYMDAWGDREFGYKRCYTMLEVLDFIDGLKDRYGELLEAVFLITNEEIEI